MGEGERKGGKWDNSISGFIGEDRCVNAGAHS